MGLDGDPLHGAGGVVEPVEQQPGGGTPALLGAEADAGQRRAGDAGELGVVHADDGDVVGDPQPALGEHLHGRDGQQVVAAQDGVGSGAVEQGESGLAALGEREVARLDEQLGIVVETELGDQLLVGPQPGRAGDGVARAVDERDPPVALGVQVLQRQPDTACGVGADVVDGQLVGHGADHDQRVGRRPQRLDQRVVDAHRAEHQPVGVPGLQAVEQRERVVGAAAGGADQQPVAADPRLVLDGAHHLDVDRVADVGDGQRELLAAAHLEAAGERVGAVAEVGRRVEHPAAHVLAGGQPVEHPGDRRDRHPGLLGHPRGGGALAHRCSSLGWV